MKGQSVRGNSCLCICVCCHLLSHILLLQWRWYYFLTVNLESKVFTFTLYSCKEMYYSVLRNASLSPVDCVDTADRACLLSAVRPVSVRLNGQVVSYLSQCSEGLLPRNVLLDPNNAVAHIGFLWYMSNNWCNFLVVVLLQFGWSRLYGGY